MKILELIISKNNALRKVQLGNDFVTGVPPAEPRVEAEKEKEMV